MSGEPFDWHGFLGRWQEEWVPRADEEDEDGEEGEPARGRLGAPGADEAAISAAEERLGRRLPPSYREFLAVSDGWYVDEMAGIGRLGGVTDIDWFRDPYGQAPQYEAYLDDAAGRAEVLLAGMWRRALRLETDSDMSHALLDPGDVDEDGEWALYVYRGWGGEFPHRHPSFRSYMEAAYRGFHSDRVERPDFVNATTRAQDARVERARLLALGGRYAEAVPLLEEASSFGRPSSRVLLNQFASLSAPESHQGYGMLVADPRYLSELLPVEAVPQAHGRRGEPGEDDYWLEVMTARGVPRKEARAVLAAVRDGSHRYAPPGAWGRAVAEAWEAARWGATDTAWRILRDALPGWEAPGPELIAPVGLLADPVLGPLVTAERGRELLATPRAGESGPVPEPVPDLDPPGLTWLARSSRRGGPFGGYRCVWVEGTGPARLPALIGEEGAGLSAPTDPGEAYRRAPLPHQREGVELWEDRAVMAVGRTGGWAFAFDGHSHSHLGELFRSPATDASASGCAVVMWCKPERWHPDGRSAVFHLSVADRGVESYAFTVRGTEVQRSGAIPEALDPARLFRPGDTGAAHEVRLLEALHTVFGFGLPRFALTRGRLPTFTSRSWTRAPREGEWYGYAYGRSGPGRRGI
ncbi:SMI1/KNR4 family protein [Streptomyces sp. JNUCC 64]